MIIASSCGSDILQSSTPADFYKGKTIDLIISSTAGGMTDRIARVIALYLERDTGANVVITNRMGTGGLDGMNYVYRSEPDGLTLGAVSSGKFVSNWVLDEPAAKYNIDEFSYIISVGSRRNHFIVSPDGPYQSITDLQASEDLKIGGASVSGPVSLGGMTVIELLELDASVITGINKTSERALMVKRGEIVGYTGSINSSQAYLDSGIVEPMFVLAKTRDSLMPDVPAITELIDIQENDMALVELWETAFVSSAIFTAPPGIPEERLAFLSELVAEWAQDEEFREEIDRASGYEVETYYIGDNVSNIMMKLASALDDFRAVFTELIEKYRA
jgi:tripartite-type tricarboxylate transporter receptor subunit TctC